MASHDVFISYPSADKVSADGVCHGLEARGIRCWMAPRDVVPGSDWQTSLLDAINDARVVVLLFTANTNGSEHIKREVTAAFEGGAVVIPFRLENVPPQGALRYHLTGVHWLDAFSGAMEPHVEQLASTIQRVLEKPVAGATAAPAPALGVVEPPPPAAAPSPPFVAPAVMAPTPAPAPTPTTAAEMTPPAPPEPPRSTIMSPPPPKVGSAPPRPAASPQPAVGAPIRPPGSPEPHASGVRSLGAQQKKGGVQPWMVFAGLVAAVVLVTAIAAVGLAGGGEAQATAGPASPEGAGMNVGVETRPEPAVDAGPLQPLEGVPQDAAAPPIDEGVGVAVEADAVIDPSAPILDEYGEPVIVDEGVGKPLE